MKKSGSLLLALVVCAVMTACSSKVDSFEETIDGIEQNRIQVDCSEEVNRNKKGPIDSIGYYCNVQIDKDTVFKNQKGQPLKLEDFSKGDRIRITLSKPVDISEKKRSFEAREIVMLAESSYSE